jgi:hypothetical protein
VKHDPYLLESRSIQQPATQVDYDQARSGVKFDDTSL